MLRWTLDPWDIIHTWWIEGHSDDSANCQFVRIQSHLGDRALGVSLRNYLIVLRWEDSPFMTGVIPWQGSWDVSVERELRSSIPHLSLISGCG